MKAIIRKSDAQEPYSFVFIDDEGDTVVRSENYSAKKSAENAIDSVKKNCVDDNRYELKESRNGKFYFNIKARNGEIIATSPMFATEAERSNAVSLMKSEAPTAAELEMELEA